MKYSINQFSFSIHLGSIWEQLSKNYLNFSKNIKLKKQRLVHKKIVFK